ncbi:MAG TPA: gliding motility-associated C-terminal domain-containing protein [Saprospiraceae bacterium]|nr:gliding motility-associated C-terminal domain-containing protein [Saprospiraceae bacterium]
MMTSLPFHLVCRGFLIVLFSTITIAPSVAQRPFTCEDQFFLTLSTIPPSLNEVIIDHQTNAVVFQNINSNIAIDVNAAGFRSTDNFIYCVNPYEGTLIRLDADGQAQVLAQLPLNLNHSYFAGDVTPDGRYLVIIGTLFFTTGGGVASDMVKIDLEDPNYGITTVSINQEAQIFDIAFQPVTGELYGYDSGSQRLVKIDPVTGDISFSFPASGVPVATGSLFFDAYGNLFAYGSPNFTSDQNSFYSINPLTGASTLLYKGPPAEASDGCSCPYTVELTKTVKPEQAFPCTDVEYTFEILNTSNRLHEGIRLEDQLPAGFTFVSVSDNPLGGNVLSNPGDSFFVLDDVDLPEGRFKIKIIVNIGQVGPGIYNNQAVLRNLPASLGGKRLSDNPATPIKDDSTSIAILAFDFDTIFVTKALCEGVESVRLNAQPFAGQVPGAVKYAWQEGSSQSYFDATTPGKYEVLLSVGCDTAYVIYTVKFSSVSVVILTEDKTTIGLGDSLFIETSAYNTESKTIFEWVDPQPGSIRCPTCPESWVRPFNDIEYLVRVQNELGCTDSASLRILVDKNKNVYFPNVFKPDGESESNGYFYPSGDAYTIISNLSVFSRWGELLFEARDIAPNDVMAGWDGTYRGESMLPGVYTWVAQVSFLDGEQFTYAGDVTLVR